MYPRRVRTTRWIKLSNSSFNRNGCKWHGQEQIGRSCCPASARSSSPSWPHLMNCLSHLHCRSPKQDYMSLHCTMRSQRNMHLHGSWTSECHRCQRMAAFATVVAVAGGHLTAPIILRRATGCLMGGHAWAGCAHGFELHSLLYHCCHPNLLIIDEMCSQGAHEWTARHVMSGLNGRGMSEASCLCGVR